MAQFDLPLEQLETYRPAHDVPADFDEFWRATLSEARTIPRDVRTTGYPHTLPLVEVLDVSYAGFGGQRINGWWIRPAGPEPAGGWPVVVHYLGYGDGRGLPTDRLFWPAAGFAVFVMDTRGQGARGMRIGATADAYGSVNPQVPGHMTNGIDDPAHYFYRRVFTDAVLAVDVARGLPGANPDWVALEGTSQGGGITLASAALSEGIKAAIINVPFLCHMSRAMTLVDTMPYGELVMMAATRRGQVDQMLRTLSYFDGLSMAPRASAPALFSVGLMDQICPPSTVFAAHNAYAGPTEIAVYPYNGHEAGGLDHQERQLDWLQAQRDQGLPGHLASGLSRA